MTKYEYIKQIMDSHDNAVICSTVCKAVMGDIGLTDEECEEILECGVDWICINDPAAGLAYSIEDVITYWTYYNNDEESEDENDGNY